jgi:hypothetical protein
MNYQQIISIAIKALLAVSGILVTLNILTPEQVASLQTALDGLSGSLATVIAAVVTIVSIIRSIKSHKKAK